MPKATCARLLRRVAARKKPTPAGLLDHKLQMHENAKMNKPIENLNCSEKLEREACNLSMSGTFQQVVNSLSAVNGTVLSEFQVRCGAKTTSIFAEFVATIIHSASHSSNANITPNQQHMTSSNGFQVVPPPQMKLLKQVTAVLADAAVGQAAPPSVRLLVRRALRTAVLATSAATHITKMWALAAVLAHGDSPQSLSDVVELMCIVSGLLFPASLPSSPLHRAVMAATALVSEGLGLGTAVDGLSHLNPQHLDLEVGVEKVLDLASSSAGLLESSQEMVASVQELMAAKQQVTLESTDSSSNDAKSGASNDGERH
ncbi:hypothetical protein Vretimale_1814 [Volvox reticuliferus]|uniref:Uncharacterized protein n=1 Tax=Volvox reticuliferus TaxID=1737510 RepID=A0A8J4FWK4_9CHLO|nr:hypothetical protein Vretifemale_17442 [Volvox reticuliferus]GIL95875.1 hypothetical protein Vretimale_1814 [Volvox reticuliferus]